MIDLVYTFIHNKANLVFYDYDLNYPVGKLDKDDKGNYDNMFSKSFKNCGLKTIKYVLCDDLTNISQHIWAYVKLLMSIENVNYDQTIYSYLMNKLNNIYMDKNSGLILDQSKKLLNMYPSNPDYLKNVILKFGKINPAKMSLSYFNNFLSLKSWLAVFSLKGPISTSIFSAQTPQGYHRYEGHGLRLD
jgi:hypothetical protein